MFKRAHGKINRTLTITGIREDGYHLIESHMVPLELHDVIHFEKAKKTSISCPGVEEDERNLALRALRLVEEAVGRPLPGRITIEKNIPIAAGLAGGTADGAAILHLVRKVYGLNLSDEKLLDIGRPLGADLVYCFYEREAMARGIGDALTFMESESHPVLLLPFEEGLSTPVIYRLYDACPQTTGENDLYPPALSLRPELEEKRQALLRAGAFEARMTGSGPTLYGLFRTEKERDLAQRELGGISTRTRGRRDDALRDF